MQNDIMSYYWS